MSLKFSMLLVLGARLIASAQLLPPVFGVEYNDKQIADNRVRKYLAPQRIVWQSDKTGKSIQGAENLLRTGTGQAELIQRNLCSLKSSAASKPGIILDYGKELHGGVQLITGIMRTG